MAPLTAPSRCLEAYGRRSVMSYKPTSGAGPKGDPDTHHKDETPPCPYVTFQSERVAIDEFRSSITDGTAGGTVGRQSSGDIFEHSCQAKIAKESGPRVIDDSVFLEERVKSRRKSRPLCAHSFYISMANGRRESVQVTKTTSCVHCLERKASIPIIS